MTRISLLCLALLFLGQSQLNAGIISTDLTSVRFDDMSAASASDTVFNADGFTITRTYSSAGFQSPVSGMFPIGVSFGYVQLDYTITTGQTFAQFFDFYKDDANSPLDTLNPSSAGSFDGFGFDVVDFNNATASEAQVRTGATIHQNVLVTGNGFYELRFGTIPLNSSSVELRFVNFGPFGSYGVNSVYAVPEPTSMVLVGSALLGLCSFRRRR